MNNTKNYIKNYKAKNIFKLQIDVNRATEQDILEWLDDNKPTATKIKQLIRDDIRKKDVK